MGAKMSSLKNNPPEQVFSRQGSIYVKFHAIAAVSLNLLSPSLYQKLPQTHNLVLKKVKHSNVGKYQN